jgi:uncharacterized phage infection (PIP) family protein YhgE
MVGAESGISTAAQHFVQLSLSASNLETDDFFKFVNLSGIVGLLAFLVSFSRQNEVISATSKGVETLNKGVETLNNSVETLNKSVETLKVTTETLKVTTETLKVDTETLKVDTETLKFQLGKMNKSTLSGFQCLSDINKLRSNKEADDQFRKIFGDD